jgi:hypothetical protein
MNQIAEKQAKNIVLAQKNSIFNKIKQTRAVMQIKMTLTPICKHKKATKKPLLLFKSHKALQISNLQLRKYNRKTASL